LEIANHYRYGTGVEKNLEKSILWYNKAIEAGNDDATNELSDLKNEMENQSSQTANNDNKPSEEPRLEENTDFKNNQEKQLEIMFKIAAANQGDAEEQYKLGLIYAQGKELKKDLVAAYKWLSLAANQGILDALKYRGKIMLEISTEDMVKANKQVHNFQPSN
jgi:uncharacterized protein